ncbi:MAG: histidinol-phosphate transaminase [Firmicutes bacterium]|nr:histidinol-phosphate transaminase [Bacillota bacterium]MBU4532643.1 histidinol-phosphate transaminase [Bacillota bacterium]MBU4554690.1 histidinol-phosphate transaminase [Bacillota bacterium]MBV1726473.1 histidinol-phosphate transaminase [Desulforudis sp.]
MKNNRFAGLVRPALRDLTPYHVPVHTGVVKLDANENPYDFPAGLLTEIFGRVDGQTLVRYPDAEARELREAIADYHGLTAENVFVGNGSDELILNLFLTFAVGGRVLIAEPTFGMYRIHSVIAGAEPVAVNRDPDFTIDSERLHYSTLNAAAQVMVLCSPNNPSGNTIPVGTVERILDWFGGIAVVDEAYFEFCGKTCVGLLERYPNLVVLRTFSKAFGLAGLRVGYMLAHPDVVQAVWRVKQPFNVDAFAQLAALAVLEHRSLFEPQIAALMKDGAVLYEQLRALPGVEAYPTEANFILFRTPHDARAVYERLLANGVLVRDLGGPGLERCLRVSIGKPEENHQFIKALGATLGSRL